MIGNNSCGTHSLLGGKTVDNVEELRVLLYDGTIMTVGPTSDEDLDHLDQQGGPVKARSIPGCRRFAIGTAI